MKVLIAVDGSQCSDTAVESVAARPWPDKSTLRVVSVFEPPPLMTMPDTWAPPDDFYEKLEKGAENQARAAVEKAAARLRAAHGGKVEIASAVLRGRARDAIVEEADGWGADLIVLGSHGYRGFTRFWLGSVSHAVANHAHCSVEIVRTGCADPSGKARQA